MGINIGAFICNIIAAFMRNRFGWGEAFISAGVGILIGLVIFSFGLKYIKKASEMQPVQEGDSKISTVLLKVFLPAIIFGFIGWEIPNNIFGSNSSDAFVFACIPVIVFYLSLYFKANKKEKPSIGALLSIFFICMFFWAIFKQNGTALTRWAKYYTDRSIPTKWVEPMRNIYMIDGKKGTEGITYENKLLPVYDNQFRTEKTEVGNPKEEIGKIVYFKNINKKEKEVLEKNPKKQVYLYNTELFQSINPFFVILLTPFVIWFWARMRKKSIEPSTPSKIIIGLLITALSCFVMYFAVLASDNGANKVSPLWLFASYSVVTIGELCLSPMGLSLVSKLSPPRITNLMMGGFFLANSIGNKLSGILSSTWYQYENKENYFLVNFTLLMFAFFIGLLMLKRLNKVMKEIET